ncbi:unnamed protein product [Lymnaea stagnalis]|uniref:Uncharacterized protein n=1 Tax=Lymnaea stagnalis TaxID=6523 RepID=A0AAV2H9D0_LYMST
MFGHLCFEVFTHGLLPYSHLELSDADVVAGIFKSAIDLKQENFITNVHFKEIISACVTFNTCQRATISKIKNRLSSLSKECSSGVYGNYPDLQKGLQKPSTAYNLVRTQVL